MLSDSRTTVALVVLCARLLDDRRQDHRRPDACRTAFSRSTCWSAIAIGFIAVLAIRTGQTLYVDIAIALGLVGFLATVAFARFVSQRRSFEEGNQ